MLGSGSGDVMASVCAVFSRECDHDRDGVEIVHRSGRARRLFARVAERVLTTVAPPTPRVRNFKQRRAGLTLSLARVTRSQGPEDVLDNNLPVDAMPTADLSDQFVGRWTRDSSESHGEVVMIWK